jgi:hypothetical protein
MSVINFLFSKVFILQLLVFFFIFLVTITVSCNSQIKSNRLLIYYVGCYFNNLCSETIGLRSPDTISENADCLVYPAGHLFGRLVLTVIP